MQSQSMYFYDFFLVAVFRFFGKFLILFLFHYFTFSYIPFFLFKNLYYIMYTKSTAPQTKKTTLERCIPFSNLD